MLQNTTRSFSFSTRIIIKELWTNLLMTICFCEISKNFQSFSNFLWTILFEKRFTTGTLLRMSNVLSIQMAKVRYLRNFLLVRFRHSDTHQSPIWFSRILHVKQNTNDTICLCNEVLNETKTIYVLMRNFTLRANYLRV